MCIRSIVTALAGDSEMTKYETAAYNKGLVSVKFAPTSYTGSLMRAFRMGKNDAAAKAGTITADQAAWLEADKAFFA
jgi:hypothetical protein